MTPKFKRLTGASFVLISMLAFATVQDNDVLTRVITQLIHYQDRRPQEKLFLHLDKPYYASGEDIWFKAYLVDGVHYQLDSSISKVLYVELLNDKHKILTRQMLYCPEGIAMGDMELPDTLKEGKYLIRAYTQYMRNMGEDFFYNKEISIFNSGGSNNQPLSHNQEMDLQFFPEGGNLVAGIENRIAFKAISKGGIGVAVEGDILDEENKVVAQFATQHKGMGSFKMLVGAGKKYMAKLKKPADVAATYWLPQVQPSGYMMQVTEVNESLKVFIYNNSDKSPTNPVYFNLVGQSRGEVYFAAKGEIKGTTITATIAKSKFPSGIAHLTVFDGAGVPQCERLVFINHQHTTNLEVTTDKKTYSKREKVSVDIVAKNSKNEPVQGNFSIAIYDADRIPDIEKYPSMITDYLLIGSDLVGHIEDPGYYLKDKAPETLKHLDLLMMTHGWRRFVWKDVLSEQTPPLKYFAEKGISIKGIVLKSLTNKPAANTKMKIFAGNGDLILTETDEGGRFHVDDLVYDDSTRITIQTDNAKGKQSASRVIVEPMAAPHSVSFNFSSFQPFNVVDFLEQAAYRQRLEQALEKDAKMLQEVEISGSRIDALHRSKLYSQATHTITATDFPPGAVSIFQAIRGKAPGMIIRGSPPSMTVALRAGQEAPLFLLDGTPVDLDVLNAINPEDVESVDVVSGNAAAAFGQRGMNGVLAVYMKKGANAGRKVIGLERFTYPGFYKAREFYVPKYDVPAEEHQRPDIRTTLLWAPSIETDQNGKAQITFFASDVVSNYRIVLQGISYDGQPGSVVSALQIK